MPKNKRNPFKAGNAVGADLKIAVDLSIKNFMSNENSNEIEFPSSLTAEERAYIHKLAVKFGLKSKSRGKGKDRFVTVYKRDGSTIVQVDAQFKLSIPNRQTIYAFLSKFPLTNKERQDLIPPIERDRTSMPDARELNKSVWRLPTSMPQIPPQSGIVQELQAFKQNLPIWNLRDEIVKVISSNPVSIIEGETGSGKTTQVPQYLLEYCRLQNKPCRIIVTEPRRLATITVAERVAMERNEVVGSTVGYQIRLECRMSPKTILSFCTTGVLLRTLMCGESNLANVTHIIVDEVHERDKFCDFLLIALRDLLNKFRNLRVVLMSASIDTPAFVKYFNNCPVISVPGRQFPVTEYFLEDVLKKIGYMTDQMKKMKAGLSNKSNQKQQLEKWKKSLDEEKTETASPVEPSKTSGKPPSGTSVSCDVQPEKTELEPWLAEEMDKLISEAFLKNDNEENLQQVIYLILSENVCVDYQHSETCVTPLMVAAARNLINSVEQLLSLGANASIRASNDWTAYDWAVNMNNSEVAELIQSYATEQVCVEQTQVKTLPPEDEELLNVYSAGTNDEVVDCTLLISLIIDIHRKQPRGAILVFLPGYDDITQIRDRITQEEKKLNEHMKYNLFILHSKMQTADQKKVFKQSPFNVRKIILSTNIAETSITIDDVVYVIDSGKVKEKSFDAATGANSLRSDWISQACAKQRKGRAGRTQPGHCYRLYSSTRYAVMATQCTPEILRVPLQELCLHSKLLAPSNATIADFLSRAIDPPQFLVTRNAVQLLKTMDALDPWEDLTELGVHLLDLPIEPRLGKTLLYSVVLKCLDPVLTIVCCLTFDNLFHIPSQAYQKRTLEACKKQLAANTYSDHMVLLRVFQSWQHAKYSSNERSFCEKNFVSSATMEMIFATRSQLLSQLRASGFVRARAPGDIRDLNTNSENWAVIKAALCAGLYPNLARVDKEHSVLRTRKECKVCFHPSSTLRDTVKSSRTSVSQAMKERVASFPTEWVMYEQLHRTGRLCHLQTCTLVSPITVAIFSGPSKLPLENISEIDMFRPDNNPMEQDSDSETEEQSDVQRSVLKLDDWVLFKVDSEAIQLALQLRQKWHAMFSRRMKTPFKGATAGDEAVVKAVVSVLSAEEQALNLTQPPGIGQRPRPCYTMKDDDYQAQGGNNTSVTQLQDTAGGVSGAGGGKNNNNKKRTESNDENRNATDKDRTRYFTIRAPTVKSIESSFTTCVWNFSQAVDRKLVRAFKETGNVVLLFYVQGAGQFYGYAKLTNVDRSSVNEPLEIQWIRRSNLLFQAAKHLLNPVNDGRRAQSPKDGQEMDSSVGAALCLLLDKPPTQFNTSNKQEESYGRPIRGFSGYDYHLMQRHKNYNK